MPTTGFGTQAWGADVGDGSGGGAGGASEAPVISFITPLSGMEQFDELIFDLIYPTAVGTPTVNIRYPLLDVVEGVYTPLEKFSKTFSTRSRTQVLGPTVLRFFIKRVGGWPSTLDVKAV